MANIEDKIAGHRKAIIEHIEKYEKYPHEYDKEYALKTIERVQKEIADLKRKKPNVGPSWEDTWKP